MTMKSKLRTAFALMPLIVCASAAGAQNPLSLSIQAENSVVNIGAELKVDIVLKNVSGRTITLDRADGTSDRAEVDYEIEMTDPSGRRAARTGYGASFTPDFRTSVQPDGSLHYPAGGSMDFFSLDAGDELRESASLDKIFTISNPGVYLVRASRKEGTGTNAVDVVSNTISVTVKK